MKGREDEGQSLISPEELADITARLSEHPLLKLPKGRLSVSQIEMYLRCARQYMLRYVRDEIRPPGVAMILGSSAHKAAEHTHHHIVDHKVPASEEEVLAAYSDCYELGLVDVPTKAKEDAEAFKVKDVGVELVKLYNKHHAPTVQPRVSPDGTRGIELKFEQDIAGVPMLGYIDLIDVNVPVGISETEYRMLQSRDVTVPEDMRTCVTDLKTKGKAASAGEIRDSLQLTVYSFVTGILAVRFDQMIKTKQPKVQRITDYRSPADHLWMQEIVRSVAMSISAGVFPPCNPVEWICSEKWCGYYSQCRGRKM